MRCPRCAAQSIPGIYHICADAVVVGRLNDDMKKQAAKSNNNVNHPPHYTSGSIECIDAIAAATVNLSGIEAVCTANAIKYLWRWKQKNGAEDLKKAQWYIKKLLDTLEVK
jgi:hypothetical protein